jgi:hypothetical protein
MFIMALFLNLVAIDPKRKAEFNLLVKNIRQVVRKET